MNLIKEQMIKKNITQEILSEKTGLSQASISLFINGKLKSVKVDNALIISEILGISIDEICKSISENIEENEELKGPSEA